MGTKTYGQGPGSSSSQYSHSDKISTASIMFIATQLILCVLPEATDCKTWNFPLYELLSTLSA